MKTPARFISWNVNGIRAAARNGFADWLGGEKADVVAVQETKAHPDQVPDDVREPRGFRSYWSTARKRGYSGVATFTRQEPDEIREGLGIAEFDAEGRVLMTRFGDVALVNAYFPNSQRDHARLPFKLRFCSAMKDYCDSLVREGRQVILCGDYNIAHREIDLKNPKSNRNNAGFLPEERAWMDTFLGGGYADVFREHEPGPDHYTWWSYRPGVREKNIGWRLDYHCVSEGLRDRVKTVGHHPDVRGSDHCPVSLEI